MKRLLVAAAAALLMLSLPAAGQQQGVTADTITIGAYGPITGPAAYIGLGGRDGMMLAIKEINAAGGVSGRKIAVIFEDDGHSPTKALAAVKKLVEQDRSSRCSAWGAPTRRSVAVDYMQEKEVLYVRFLRVGAAAVTWPLKEPVPGRHDRVGALRRTLRRVPLRPTTRRSRSRS